MPQIINLQEHKDPRGVLYVVEKLLPFTINRFYFIRDVPSDIVRGGHKHKKTWQAAICVSGSCTFTVLVDGVDIDYVLNNPSICLIIRPEDWHEMKNFSSDAVLLVMASEFYDKNDYIDSKFEG